MRRIVAVMVGAVALGGSTVAAQADDDEVLAAFSEWLASTDGVAHADSDSGVMDLPDLDHLACAVDDDGAAICNGLDSSGWGVAFYSPDPSDGEWMLARDRPIANEDRPRPSEDVDAASYTSEWQNPTLESVSFFARDDELPSTELGNYGIEWNPAPADSGDGWVRVQGFAEAVGCDIPTEPPLMATTFDC